MAEAWRRLVTAAARRSVTRADLTGAGRGWRVVTRADLARADSRQSHLITSKKTILTSAALQHIVHLKGDDTLPIRVWTRFALPQLAHDVGHARGGTAAEV